MKILPTAPKSNLTVWPKPLFSPTRRRISSVISARVIGYTSAHQDFIQQTRFAVVVLSTRMQRERRPCHARRLEWIAQRAALGRDVAELPFDSVASFHQTPRQKVRYVHRHVLAHDHDEVREIQRG